MGPWCADYFINHYTQVIKERREQHSLYVTLSLADLEALIDRIKEDQWILTANRTSPKGQQSHN